MLGGDGIRDEADVVYGDHVVDGWGRQDSEVCGVHVAGLPGESALAADDPSVGGFLLVGELAGRERENKGRRHSYIIPANEGGPYIT